MHSRDSHAISDNDSSRWRSPGHGPPIGHCCCPCRHISQSYSPGCSHTTPPRCAGGQPCLCNAGGCGFSSAQPPRSYHHGVPCPHPIPHPSRQRQESQSPSPARSPFIPPPPLPNYVPPASHDPYIPPQLEQAVSSFVPATVPGTFTEAVFRAMAAAGGHPRASIPDARPVVPFVPGTFEPTHFEAVGTSSSTGDEQAPQQVEPEVPEETHAPLVSPRNPRFPAFPPNSDLAHMRMVDPNVPWISSPGVRVATPLPTLETDTPARELPVRSAGGESGRPRRTRAGIQRSTDQQASGTAMVDRGASGSSQSGVAVGTAPAPRPARRIARFGSIWDPVEYVEEETQGAAVVEVEGGEDVSGRDGEEGDTREPRERRGIWFRRRRPGMARTEERRDEQERRGGIWRALRRVLIICVYRPSDMFSHTHVLTPVIFCQPVSAQGLLLAMLDSHPRMWTPQWVR